MTDAAFEDAGADRREVFVLRKVLVEMCEESELSELSRPLQGADG